MGGICLFRWAQNNTINVCVLFDYEFQILKLFQLLKLTNEKDRQSLWEFARLWNHMALKLIIIYTITIADFGNKQLWIALAESPEMYLLGIIIFLTNQSQATTRRSYPKILLRIGIILEIQYSSDQLTPLISLL